MRGLRLGHALLEFVHAPGGVHELLLAGVKRMADVADADDDRRLGGAGFDHVAARATDFRVHVFRMNISSHKRRVKVSFARGLTRVNFEMFARRQDGAHPGTAPERTKA